MPSPFTHAIVLDFEATCDQGRRVDPQEIIEFPSALLALDSLEVIDEFSSFVRPQHHPVLSGFCRKLTSIDQSDVDVAPSFPEVFATHRAWLERHGLNRESADFVTCGDWDLARCCSCRRTGKMNSEFPVSPYPSTRA
jgi:inhibitor of KinA sporulation pathway (predicted exonuclease)